MEETKIRGDREDLRHDSARRGRMADELIRD